MWSGKALLCATVVMASAVARPLFYLLLMGFVHCNFLSGSLTTSDLVPRFHPEYTD